MKVYRSRKLFKSLLLQQMLTASEVHTPVQRNLHVPFNVNWRLTAFVIRGPWLPPVYICIELIIGARQLKVDGGAFLHPAAETVIIRHCLCRTMPLRVRSSRVITSSVNYTTLTSPRILRRRRSSK
ncbi:hypothetical protein AcV5_009894 [Taiwanofungus camphoratus]|nr:hypothetical protein AcV5_009894 [Antrodia cinnamomea]